MKIKNNVPRFASRKSGLSSRFGGSSALIWYKSYRHMPDSQHNTRGRLVKTKIKTWRKRKNHKREDLMCKRRGRIDVRDEDQKIVPCFCFMESVQICGSSLDLLLSGINLTYSLHAIRFSLGIEPRFALIRYKSY
jgi:hypothetical protein